MKKFFVACILAILISGCTSQTALIELVKRDCGTDYVRTLPQQEGEFIAIDRNGNVTYYFCDTSFQINIKEILFCIQEVTHSNSIHFYPTIPSLTNIVLER